MNKIMSKIEILVEWMNKKIGIINSFLIKG